MNLPTGDEYARLKKAFDNLRGNPSWDVIVEYLKRRQAASLNRMAIVEDELRLRWAQGEAQLLNEILKIIEL